MPTFPKMSLSTHESMKGKETTIMPKHVNILFQDSSRRGEIHNSSCRKQTHPR